MELYIKSDREWLYPDEECLGSAPYAGQTISICTASGSPAGIQMLVTGATGRVHIDDPDGCPGFEVFLLRDVLVNYNTAEEMQGFGNHPFVYTERQAEAPPHCTRSAPFRVYDPFKPYEGESAKDGRLAFYLCFTATGDVGVGAYHKRLTIRSGNEERRILVDLHVYEVGLTEKQSFRVSNWFSVEGMAVRHGLEMFSPEHFAMVGQYADAMRRMRQTHFLLNSGQILIREQDGQITFDFSRVEKLAELFFEKGFEAMEFGPVGTRERVYQENLFVLNRPDAPVNSERGETLLRRFFSGMADMVERRGWQEKLLFHIADEPDEPEGAIPARLPQYGRIVEIMREYLPRARVCEAVKTTRFQPWVDILVPLSKTVEESPDEFAQARSEGREVWFYICCVPTGNYYQRFLDVPLLSARYAFWAGVKYGLTGYLHWGLNQLEPDQNPFEQTNQRHSYGDGVCLPAGDSHVLYPDRHNLYFSMRGEICRKGAEDAELLMKLREVNAELYHRLLEGIPGFHGPIDSTRFEDAYCQLLSALSKRS